MHSLYDFIRRQRAGNKCQICSGPPPLQNHHNNPSRPYGRTRLEDMTLLCNDCHAEIAAMLARRSEAPDEARPLYTVWLPRRLAEKYLTIGGADYDRKPLSRLLERLLTDYEWKQAYAKPQRPDTGNVGIRSQAGD
jgi:hypothetical protein